MKLLEKLKSLFKRKPKTPKAPMNRAERRRMMQTFKKAYVKNIRNQDGTRPLRAVRRQLASKQAKADVIKLFREQVLGNLTPSKFSLTALLYRLAYKLRLARVKWRLKFPKVQLPKLTPALEGT